jgi:ER-bound oxygenase mpaB/B'/Rubber oxygenase, catalytic domain
MSAAPFQTAEHWTDDVLEPMRHVGDPLADKVISTLVDAGEIASVNAVMRNLVENEYWVPETLPAIVRDYLQSTADLPPWADSAKIAAGQQVFWRYGPRLILILHCYSLPFCYVARKGVQVLALTSRLTGNAARRIVETAQMLVDVMQPGGLESPEGRGRRTIQKVRLMHAAVRRLAVQSPAWRNEFDLPVNQEDLAGTLMSFSWIALDGLEKLGILLSDTEKEAYLHCWQVIGHQLGILGDVTPVDIASARALAGSVARRQFAPSAEGKDMTRALVETMQYMLPGNLLDGLPALFISYFLGREHAGMIGIGQDGLADVVAAPLRIGGTVFSGLLRDSQPLRALAEKVGQLLINSIVYVERGGNRPSFTIPAELKQQWGVNWVS